MSEETKGEPKKEPYEFQINFSTYDPISEAERLGLIEIIRRKMDELTNHLDVAFSGKSFHLTQSHGVDDE